MSAEWKFDAHALVVDDDDQFRDVTMRLMELSGCTCYGASTYEQALDTCKEKSAIQLAIVDQIPGSMSVDSFVTSLRSLRPQLALVGNSGADRAHDFAQVGVTSYLQKPWDLRQLFGLLAGRITACAECGLELPLRRPAPGEAGESWACAFCGSRYYAVVAHDVLDEIRSNARHIE